MAAEVAKEGAKKAAAAEAIKKTDLISNNEVPPMEKDFNSTKENEGINKFTLTDQLQVIKNNSLESITAKNKADLPEFNKLKAKDFTSHEGIIGKELSNIKELQPSIWETLSKEERIATFQKSADVLFEKLNLEKRQIGYEKMREGVNGGYNFFTRQITLNDRLLELKPTEAINTFAHEIRHTWQFESFENSKLNPSYWLNRDDKALIDNIIDIKRDFTKYYIDPQKEGYFAYAGQPVEIDASNFGTKVAQTYLEGIAWRA